MSDPGLGTAGALAHVAPAELREALAVAPAVVAERPAPTEPRVSIITCTHNRPDMLKECIASMREQTRGDWEHLIVDSGSTDEQVVPILEKAVNEDPRLRVYLAGANIDQPARRWNDLIDRARGHYIGFLDDDNEKLPRFVEVMAGVLDARPDVDIVTCGFIIRQAGSPDSEHHGNLRTAEDIALRSTIDSGCFLIRREALEAIGYFPLDIRTNEDWALLRRAAASLRMEHLGDALATYRVHGEQRMARCEDLGNARDKQTILSTAIWQPYVSVEVHHPPLELLTSSQRDVVDGVKAGLAAIPWVTYGDSAREGIAVVLGTFRMDFGQAEDVARNARTVVSVHAEDPYAVFANSERVKVLASHCEDTWVATCDPTCVEPYREIVGEKVVICPSLSVDHRAVPGWAPMAEREVDVLLVGYPYPSRIQFVRDFFAHFDERRVHLRGDGWKNAGFAMERTTPTTSALDTAGEYARARAVICLHRIHGDCGGGPYEPKLVQRGYVEGVGGARVFVDRIRDEHSFEEGEVEWFDGPRDLAEKLRAFLKMRPVDQEMLAEPLRQRVVRDFTYRTRMARILNAVRSPRFGAVIP